MSSRLSPQRLVLSNGIVLLVTHNPTSDIIAARLFLQAGMLRENSSNWGLSHLVASVITKGTEQYNAQELAQVVESVGASLGTDSSSDYFLVSLKTVSEDFERIFELAAEILRSPTFPEKELNTERNVTLQGIKSRKEQSLANALRPLRQELHGEHPYAQTSYGVLETVEQIQSQDLHQFHRDYFRPDELVISIAGNITLEEAERFAQKYLGDWNNTTEAQPRVVVKKPPKVTGLKFLPQVRDSQQTTVAFGYPAASVHHPDYLGLKFLINYLCNGMSSRLFTELREKQGLAYEVSGFYPTRQDSTHLVTYLGTTPNKAEHACNEMQRELTRLAEGAMTADELAIAKRKWAGQYALGKQTNAQLAQIFGWYEILGLSENHDQVFLEEMKAYPLERVHEVAQNSLDHAICSIVGPEDSIQFAC